MGELKDVLAPALSSTNRAKSHWRGKTLKSKTPAVDAFACNEVRLLVSCLACEIMHIARRAMAAATGTGWSLRRLRERVLRAGARLLISSRRMTLALSSAQRPSGPSCGQGSGRCTGPTHNACRADRHCKHRKRSWAGRCHAFRSAD